MLDNILQTIKKWFPKARAKIQEGASEIEAKLSSSPGKEISSSLFNKLNQKITQLEPNLVYQTFIGQNLSQALDNWQKNCNSSNHLVISSIPVEPLEIIIEQTLDNIIIKQELTITFLKGIPRKYDEDEIANYLDEQLRKIKNNPQAQLIIIPDLSRFFFRSVKGLAIIDSLLICVGEDSKNFWLLGCDNWLWLYLQKVSDIDTYLDNKKNLPNLTPQELKQWLNPIFKNFKFNWISIEETDKITENNNFDPDKWTSEQEKKFFNSLAYKSGGSSYIAGNLWLNSLSVIEVEISENKELKEEKIIATLPSYPDFTIQQTDRQLIYAIGCHGKISINNLANILGEEQIKLKAQIHRLIKLKLISYDGELISLNSLTYPKLIDDLKYNHFLIG